MRKHKAGYFAGALLLATAASATLPSPASASYRAIGTRGGFLAADGTDESSLLSGLIDWLTGDSDAGDSASG